MISWTHLSTRNIGTKEKPNEVEVQTPLELADDVVSTTNCLGYEPTIEVAIGFLPNDKRRYVTLPFWQAMALEGYKLHINAKVSPKKTDGMSESDRAEIIETLATGEQQTRLKGLNSIFHMLNAKAKKALVDELRELDKADGN